MPGNDRTSQRLMEADHVSDEVESGLSLDGTDQSVCPVQFRSIPPQHKFSGCVRVVQLAMDAKHFLHYAGHALDYGLCRADEPQSHHQLDIWPQTAHRITAILQQLEKLLVGL